MKNLEKQAMAIVAQLFDLAEVPVDKRQEINDVAYDYVTEQLIITDVGVTLLCDVGEGTKCKDPFPKYRTGVCRNCGGQSN